MVSHNKGKTYIEDDWEQSADETASQFVRFTKYNCDDQIDDKELVPPWVPDRHSTTQSPLPAAVYPTQRFIFKFTIWPWTGACSNQMDPLDPIYLRSIVIIFPCMPRRS